MNHKHIFIIAVSFFILNCTENPFSSKKDNQIEKEKISGQVLLEDRRSPDSIFIWVEKFDIATSTDSLGKFSMILPLAENQAGGSGFDGLFNIFFFMGNYAIDSVKMEMTEGKLAKDQTYFDNKGKLKEPVKLHPYLHFETKEVQHAEIDHGVHIIDFDTLAEITSFIDVAFEVFDETRTVSSLREDIEGPGASFFRTGMIFEPVEPEDDFVFIESSRAEEQFDAMLKNSDPVWTFQLDLFRADFSDAEYWVYPYLKVWQPEVPESMFDALGREKMTFGPDYLDFPIRRTPLKVRFERK
ncbi:MAG: hypothetical protein ACLFQM_07850 [Fidelibacterota bacterium]